MHIYIFIVVLCIYVKPRINYFRSFSCDRAFNYISRAVERDGSLLVITAFFLVILVSKTWNEVLRVFWFGEGGLIRISESVTVFGPLNHLGIRSLYSLLVVAFVGQWMIDLKKKKTVLEIKAFSQPKCNLID